MIIKKRFNLENSSLITNHPQSPLGSFSFHLPPCVSLFMCCSLFTPMKAFSDRVAHTCSQVVNDAIHTTVVTVVTCIFSLGEHSAFREDFFLTSWSFITHQAIKLVWKQLKTPQVCWGVQGHVRSAFTYLTREYMALAVSSTPYSTLLVRLLGDDTEGSNESDKHTETAANEDYDKIMSSRWRPWDPRIVFSSEWSWFSSVNARVAFCLAFWCLWGTSTEETLCRTSCSPPLMPAPHIMYCTTNQ